MAHEPVLLEDRTPRQRVLLVGVVPAVFGIAAGLFLGVAAVVYWILQVIATVGAFGGAVGAAIRARRSASVPS